MRGVTGDVAELRVIYIRTYQVEISSRSQANVAIV